MDGTSPDIHNLTVPERNTQTEKTGRAYIEDTMKRFMTVMQDTQSPTFTQERNSIIKQICTTYKLPDDKEKLYEAQVNGTYPILQLIQVAEDLNAYTADILLQYNPNKYDDSSPLKKLGLHNLYLTGLAQSQKLLAPELLFHQQSLLN